MPDALSPIQHTLVLCRVDPEHGIARFYSLMIERNLFGTVHLVRNWSRIGANGRELVQEFETEEQAVGLSGAVSARYPLGIRRA